MNPGRPSFDDGVHLWSRDPRPSAASAASSTSAADVASAADAADVAEFVDPVEIVTFSLLCPPPLDPPPHATHPNLWGIQLHWWWRHTPAHLAAYCCAFCTRPWPCPSWFHWDDLLRRNSRAV